jgi:ornithine cyclodeaminase/alanine dehydrogenase-like protein (mu-crystallin family)
MSGQVTFGNLASGDVVGGGEGPFRILLMGDFSGRAQRLPIQRLAGRKRIALDVDNWEQASHGGEINVAVSRGLMRRGDIYAELGEIVVGRKPGRQDPHDVTVFDSTGLAIQDAACAAYGDDAAQKKAWAICAELVRKTIPYSAVLKSLKA